MQKCVICSKAGIFKIKGEDIYYCKEHAEDFFPLDALENISKLETGLKQAEKLKELVGKKGNE